MSSIYYGIVLIGIGDSTYPTTPACIYAGDATVSGANAYLNFLGLADSSDSLSTQINPITGQVQRGSTSFVMAAPLAGLDGPTGETLDVVSLFGSRVIEAQGLLADSLSSATSGASGSIVLFSRDGAAFSAGDIVYIEDETIILDSLSSSSAPNKTQTFACTRGAFGSRARAHSATPGTGAPPSPVSGYDNRVYTKPRMVGRECQIVEFNGDSVVVRQYGIFEARPEQVNLGSGLKVTIRDVWSLFNERKLNKRPLGADGQGRYLNFQPAWRGFQGSLTADDFSVEWGPIVQEASPVNEVVMQIGNAPVPCTYVVSTANDAAEYVFNAIDLTSSGYAQSAIISNAPVPDLESNYDVRERGNLTTQDFYYELLALGESIVDGSGTYVGAATDLHPITAWEHHLMSTGLGTNTHSSFTSYDDWAYPHGLGIPSQWVDRQGLKDIRDDYPDSMSIDMLFFGWGGKDYSASEFRDKVLRPFWLYPHHNATGQISASVFEPILPDDPSLITISSDRIVALSEDQDFGWDDVINSVKVEYGQPWWDKKGEIVARDRPRSTSWWDPEPVDPDITFDVTALNGGAGTDFGPRQIFAKALLDWKARPISRYQAVIQGGSPALDLYAGAKVFFDVNPSEYDMDGYYISRDGEVATTLEVYGIIDEISRNFEDHTVNVSILGINETLVKNPKRIAPAYEVKQALSGTEIAFLKDFNGADMFADFTSGLTTLTHFTRAGGRQSTHTVDTVASIDSTSFKITFDATVSPSPVEGDYFRLAPRTDSEGETYNDTYAYVADQFEVFDDGDDGDIYV